MCRHIRKAYGPRVWGSVTLVQLRGPRGQVYHRIRGIGSIL